MGPMNEARRNALLRAFLAHPQLQSRVLTIQAQTAQQSVREIGARTAATPHSRGTQPSEIQFPNFGLALNRKASYTETLGEGKCFFRSVY